MTRKHFVTMLTVLTILLLSVTMATAQGPQSVGNGICPPGNTYSSGCDVATPLGKIDVVDVQRIAGRWHTTGTYTEPYWSLTGNAGIDPAANFLGTTDNQPVVFKTNGAEAMRIDTGGEVGIGTSSPTAKLTIGGVGEKQTHGDSAIHVAAENNYFDFDTGLLFRGTGGNWSARFTSTSNMDGDGEILGVYTEESTPGDLGEAIAVFKNNGNVGIGTTDPTDKLHVYDDTDSAITLGRAGGDSIAQWRYTDVGHVEFGPTGHDALGFITNDSVRMWIVEEGNIGIGTGHPQAKLEVASASGDGIRVDSAGEHGVIISSTNDSIHATSTNDDGMFVKTAASDGGGQALRVECGVWLIASVAEVETAHLRVEGEARPRRSTRWFFRPNALAEAVFGSSIGLHGDLRGLD